MFKENLRNFTDFRRDPDYYQPFIDLKNHTIDNFRTTEEPQFIHERDLDPADWNFPIRRMIGNSMHASNYKNDKMNKQIEPNNTHIMRGIHVTVRDFDNKLINDEYGPRQGPFADSRKTIGKTIWYRPSEHMDPKYKDGDEDKPGFVIKNREFFMGKKHSGVQNKLSEKELFEIVNSDEKYSWFFAKVKRSIYLPKCLRNVYTVSELGHIWWVRCPKGNQGPVKNDFYNLLGIEQGKDYIFEVQPVW